MRIVDSIGAVDTVFQQPVITITSKFMNRSIEADKISARRKRPRWLFRFFLLFLAVYVLPVIWQLGVYYFDADRTSSWWDLRNDSSRQAPDPITTNDAIIQVYAARAVRWRGAVGVHGWVAFKRSSENFYTRLEVMGYALHWSGETVQSRRGRPDRYWFGSRPMLLREIRGGDKVDQLIDELEKSASAYQHNHEYRIWPGPNSNTFIAHLGRKVPELNLELPGTAIGKDYLPRGRVFSLTPSGRGLQISAAGYVSLIIGLEEGIELNLLGISAGIDLSPPAIKLPAVGRIGFSDFERIELR